MSNRKLARPCLLLVAILTVTAWSCSAVSNLPNPFASATPTATQTFTPTITPSPTPTWTPTATPVPTGTVLQKAPGGGTRFFDYDGGYMIDVPADWVAVLLEPGDLEAAISEFANSNPSLANALKNSQATASKAFRMVAYDKIVSHYTGGYVANFTAAMFQDKAMASLPMDLVVQVTMDQVKKQIPAAKTKILPSAVNAHALPIGLSEVEVTVRTPDGNQIAIYEKWCFVQTKNALVVITLSAPQSTSDAVKPLFDTVFDGIKLLQP
ncbi:MAG TPA: hypothetical protein VF784_00840 [Anaerolineales bacterium]